MKTVGLPRIVFFMRYFLYARSLYNKYFKVHSCCTKPSLKELVAVWSYPSLFQDDIVIYYIRYGN